VLTGLLIGVREGVEAALIIGILVSYLVRTGNRRHLPKIWLGTAAAVAASFVLGLALFLALGGLKAPYEQLFEGLTMLLASAIVTWMLFWMRSQSRAIRGHLESRLAFAVAAGGAWGLAGLAFVSVVREGIETSLFLVGQVTAVENAGRGDGAGVALGALVGLLIAAALGYLIYRGSSRLDLRTFFTLTGVGLVFIAAGLVSRAVHEFIEVGLVGVGTQPAFDVSKILPDGDGLGQFLHATLGYSAAPEIVTLAVYLLYLVPVLVLYLMPARSGSATSQPVRA